MFERPEEPPARPGAPAQETTDPSVVDLDEVLHPRVSPRRRAIQAGAVLLVVAVIVGALLHGVGPSALGAASVLPSPTPIPPTVVIQSNVNFGRVSLNGHQLKGGPPLVTHAVHTGINVVTLAAPPFRSLTCHFQFPSDQPSDEPDCSGGGLGGGFEVNGVPVFEATLFTLDLISADLPPTLAAGAYAAAMQAVADIRPHTVVPAGQYYATGLDGQGHIISRRASAPLQADLVFGPVDPEAAGGPGFCGPSQFCDAPLDPTLSLPSDQHVWSVGLAISERWRFTPEAGQPTLSPALPLYTPIQVLLAYAAAGGWNAVLQGSGLQGGPGMMPLAGQLVSGLCNAGSILVTTMEQQARQQNGYGLNFPHDQGVEGCEMQAIGSDNTTVQATFLWRFSVLLAVDKGAHTLFAWAPIAPKAEVAAVER